MKRRHALFGILGLSIGLPAARKSIAQSAAKIPVIGLLDAGERVEWWAGFREQLRKLGYVEGQNISIEARFASGKPERLQALAQELAYLDVAAIVTAGTDATLGAQRVTDKIPIVMATGTDVVSLGFVASLARPGGNVTGVSSISADLTGKRLNIIREVVPRLSRLAVIYQRGYLGTMTNIKELETAATSSRISLQHLGVKNADELVGAFVAATRERAEAVFAIHSPFLFPERRRLAELALKHRLPSIYGPSEYVAAGGLLSYATSYPGLFRRAAVYVDKILKGAKPGDLPIEQPTTFELVINLKTAKALGIKIPQSVLIRADRVIE